MVMPPGMDAHTQSLVCAGPNLEVPLKDVPSAVLTHVKEGGTKFRHTIIAHMFATSFRDHVLAKALTTCLASGPSHRVLGVSGQNFSGSRIICWLIAIVYECDTWCIELGAHLPC